MHLRKTCGDGKGDVEGTREGLVHDICDMHLVIALGTVRGRVGAVDGLGVLAGAGRHLDPGIASPMRLARCAIESREQSEYTRM